jgi:hypothetical protein
MWTRDLELTLALWLLVSPFVFGHDQDVAWWATDLGCGTATLLIALLARWERLRRVHLLHLITAAWLAVFGWTRSPAPAAQNELVVGLLLALVAILPSEANAPPRSWRALAARGGTT